MLVLSWIPMEYKRKSRPSVNMIENTGNSNPQPCGMPFLGSSGRATPIPPCRAARSRIN